MPTITIFPASARGRALLGGFTLALSALTAAATSAPIADAAGEPVTKAAPVASCAECVATFSDAAGETRS